MTTLMRLARFDRISRRAAFVAGTETSPRAIIFPKAFEIRRFIDVEPALEHLNPQAARAQSLERSLARIALAPAQSRKQPVRTARQTNQVEAAILARTKNRIGTQQRLASLFDNPERQTRRIAAYDNSRVGTLERAAQRALHPVSQVAVALQPDLGFDRGIKSRIAVGDRENQRGIRDLSQQCPCILEKGVRQLRRALGAERRYETGLRLAGTRRFRKDADAQWRAQVVLP